MATRASIKLSDKNGNFIANIYHHYDGYPEYLGQKLLDIVNEGPIVNGLGMGSTGTQFNGFADLACSIVSELKDETGGGRVYLYTEDDFGNCGEDYLYEIIENSEGTGAKVFVQNIDDDWEFVEDILARTESLYTDDELPF